MHGEMYAVCLSHVFYREGVGRCLSRKWDGSMLSVMATSQEETTDKDCGDHIVARLKARDCLSLVIGFLAWLLWILFVAPPALRWVYWHVLPH